MVEIKKCEACRQGGMRLFFCREAEGKALILLCGACACGRMLWSEKNMIVEECLR